MANPRPKTQVLLTLIIVRKEYHIVKLLGSIEFVLTTKVLINAATI